MDQTEVNFNLSTEIGDIKLSLGRIEERTACLSDLKRTVDSHGKVIAAIKWIGGAIISLAIGLAVHALSR